MEKAVIYWKYFKDLIHQEKILIELKIVIGLNKDIETKEEEEWQNNETGKAFYILNWKWQRI